MQQILQSLKTGETQLENLPATKVRPNALLINTHKSLVSAGTERMLVDFGKASYISKARQQPEKVKMVLQKIKTDGLMTTIDAVKSKLDQASPMGYCNVGNVLKVGSGAAGFAVGDRIVSNGNHSEIVCVPKNLCAKIPDNVSDEDAAFTVLGAIALQGIRLTKPTLGETVVVSGLGLVGLLTVQLLRANGCNVIGMDFNPSRLALAKQFGAKTINLAECDNPVEVAIDQTSGRGVDAVIITAATNSNEPVHHAAQMCRKRGRIVLVGVTGLELSRADFYEKELSFQVSCSYGPGRYDPSYEDNGNDYPIGFVRWTEQRNFEAVLDMMSAGAINVKPLISHRFELQQAADAYELLTSKEPSLGILLNYPNRFKADDLQRTIAITDHKDIDPAKANIAFIGAGNYASRMLMPAFSATPANLINLATSGGISGVHFGKKFKFAKTTTDTDTIWGDSNINTVVIATRHNTHARFVNEGLKAGKHVFVEKPLCLTKQELEQIINTYQQHDKQILMLGFNRRFAPQIVKIKSLLEKESAPKCFMMTINAGMIPADHWVHDKMIGGGRIIGEACHFVDLLRHLAGTKITSHQVMKIGGNDQIKDDKVMIQLQFEDGSIGSIHYLANGHKSVSKERLEIFCAEKILQLDNFRKLKGYGWKGFDKLNLSRQDKGQNACVKQFVEAIEKGLPSPISFDEIIEISNVIIDINEKLTQ